MRRNRPAFPLILLLLVGCQSHRAPATRPADAPRFLRASSINVLELLPDPPSASSTEMEQEYATLSRVQTARSPADVARARREATMTVFLFDDVLGLWFSPQNCARTAKLFLQIGTDARFFSNSAKKHWNRLRPATRPGFTPLLSEESTSYPSGHSTRATVWAEILANIFPDKRNALLERGRQIGFDRVIAGVHFPSDVYAGRVIGHNVARELLANPVFRVELERVKAELDNAAWRSDAGAVQSEHVR